MSDSCPLYYIGKSKNVAVRKKAHFSSYLNPDKYLRIHKIIVEQGKDKWRVEILEDCPPQQLNEREYHHIKEHIDDPNCLNERVPWLDDTDRKARNCTNTLLYKARNYDKVNERNRNYMVRYREEKNESINEKLKTKKECPACRRMVSVRNFARHIKSHPVEASSQ